MIKNTSSTQNDYPWEHGILGETEGLFTLAGREENRAISLALVRQAQRNLTIFTRDLDPALYDQMEFIEALTRLALAGPHARIRILALDPAAAVKRGHRLVELARRLSSYIQIRTPAEQHRNHAGALLIADDTGLVYRPLASRYEASASFHAPLEARRHLDNFNEAWEHAFTDPELRRLHL